MNIAVRNAISSSALERYNHFRRLIRRAQPGWRATAKSGRVIGVGNFI
jgi:hypothetical protein